MIHAYKVILEQSRKKKDQTKKYLEKLKKSKVRNLDQVVMELDEEVWSEIDCLQCANCCATTGPLLLDKDIERLAKSLKMRPANFTETFLKIDEDKDYVFKAMPCPFLGDDKYCSQYESRPNACREYPHTAQRNFSVRLKITYENSMICPAVALIVDRLKLKIPL
ncbi:YkgJ family cysteine cluster protein [Bacteroidota bacterium]